jgi:hypothetical protein
MIMYKLLITPDWDELRLPHLYSSGPHLHCHVHLASNKKLKIFIICKDNKMLFKRNHHTIFIPPLKRTSTPSIALVLHYRM